MIVGFVMLWFVLFLVRQWFDHHLAEGRELIVLLCELMAVCVYTQGA